MIHPTAFIHPNAKLHSTIVIGPFAVIGEGVELGARCIVGPHVNLMGLTTAGTDNVFHAGCVIGDAPVDLHYKGEPTRLRIGDHNVFREQVTVNCSNTPDEDTVIGSHNLLTPQCHVGHNTVIGNHTVIGSGARLAGHVLVQDRVFISGNCLVHQFCRIGTLALMQGGSAISKDLAPFTVAEGRNSICGLNVVGLRRGGFTPEQRLELKRIYRQLFRDGQNLRATATTAQMQFATGPVRTMLDFIIASKRGVCCENTKDAASDSEA
jgi:UDP-N-acetylglucosamine acyltransferase